MLITDIKKETFKILPNNAFNRIKYGFFENEAIKVKLSSDILLEETMTDKVFHIKYFDKYHTTEIEEFKLIGEIVEKAINNDMETAIILLTEYVETAISHKIQKDLILYLLGSYSERLRFFDDHILIDSVFKVYYDCFRNHQDVLKHIVTNPTLSNYGEKRFYRFCLVKIPNKDFIPTWFKIGNSYYVLTKNGCEILSKILFLLEAEKHKKDSVFWNQVKHLYEGNPSLIDKVNQ